MINLSGKLRSKIELWHRVSSDTRNEIGTRNYTDSKVADVWALVQPQTAKQVNGAFAETRLQETTHKIIVRYREDIAHDMWFKYKGERYDIIYILNPTFSNEYLEVYCKVVVS